jgi:hypothetical protein
MLQLQAPHLAYALHSIRQTEAREKKLGMELQPGLLRLLSCQAGAEVVGRSLSSMVSVRYILVLFRVGEAQARVRQLGSRLCSP